MILLPLVHARPPPHDIGTSFQEAAGPQWPISAEGEHLHTYLRAFVDHERHHWRGSSRDDEGEIVMHGEAHERGASPAGVPTAITSCIATSTKYNKKTRTAYGSRWLRRRRKGDIRLYQSWLALLLLLLHRYGSPAGRHRETLCHWPAGILGGRDCGGVETDS